MPIYGNMIGGGTAPLKTLILVDENGNEVVGVVTESVQAFSATPEDVKIGKTFVSDDGISEGTDTRTYRTTTGGYMIRPNAKFAIPLAQYKQYDYTAFQCMITLIDRSDINNSVNTSMVSIKDAVYEVNSTTKLSDVLKDDALQTIDLNITNNSENYYFIHYFTYRKEE